MKLIIYFFNLIHTNNECPISSCLSYKIPICKPNSSKENNCFSIHNEFKLNVMWSIDKDDFHIEEFINEKCNESLSILDFNIDLNLESFKTIFKSDLSSLKIIKLAYSLNSDEDDDTFFNILFTRYQQISSCAFIFIKDETIPIEKRILNYFKLTSQAFKDLNLKKKLFILGKTSTSNFNLSKLYNSLNLRVKKPAKVECRNHLIYQIGFPYLFLNETLKINEKLSVKYENHQCSETRNIYFDDSKKIPEPIIKPVQKNKSPSYKIQTQTTFSNTNNIPLKSSTIPPNLNSKPNLEIDLSQPLKIWSTPPINQPQVLNPKSVVNEIQLTKSEPEPQKKHIIETPSKDFRKYRFINPCFIKKS